MTDPRIRISAVDESKAAFASVLSNFDALKGRAAGFATTFGSIRSTIAGVGVALGALSGANIFKGAIDAGDQLNKLSQKVGISVEKLSELKFAAELSDVSLEQLQKGLRGLADVMVKANDPTSQEARLLRDLGVTAKEPLGALRQLADAFQALPDGITKTDASAELFGARVGQELIPLLNQGSAGLDEASLSARRLGLILSTETGKAAEEFNDNLKKLGTASETFGIAITSKLIKGLADYTSALVKSREAGQLWNGILEQGLRLSVRAAELLPGAAGKLAEVGSAALQARALAEQQDIARRTAVGKIGGATPAPADPDREARVQCTLSGGTWDARARRCVPKPTGPKQLSETDLAAQVSLNVLRKQEEAAFEGEKKAEEFEKARLERESDRAVLQAQRLDEAREAADQQVRANQDLARSFVDLVDPTAQWVRQLEQARELAKGGFLSSQQLTEIEFSIQTQIDKTIELGDETKRTKSLTEELGLTMVSSAEEALTNWTNFRDVLKGIEKDILRIVTRKVFTEPLGEFISKAAKGSGLGDIVSSIFSIFKPKAFGGPVSAGGSYLVGERGPELFRPSQSGTIVPNSAMGGGVTINVSMPMMPQGVNRDTLMEGFARLGHQIAVAMERNG